MAPSVDPVMLLIRLELVLAFYKSIIGMPLENAKNFRLLSLPVSLT